MARNYEYLTQYDSKNFTAGILSLLRFGRKRTIDAITIHHWGARGQSFMGVVHYLCRKGGNTSAHEVIIAGRVAVIVDHKNIAWHAGNGKGNATTIGLELHPEGTEADYRTAAERIADLREVYGNLPLIPHRSWKATSCPGDWSLSKLDRMADEILADRKKAAAKPAGDVKPAGSGKPRPKPMSKPKPKKGTRLHLPKTVSKWGIYKLGAAPVKRNVFAYLNPQKFGGLTYDILRWTVPNEVAVVKTSQYGTVQIYVAKGTGAVIK
ncbi:peptidoglycan recognition protein family protein [Paeniglutamicibacter sp. R2-26]|uniref:peptidoglycan recognition protein family protein n=1 Tax=Paeniglutamicibacter sp. R2-26 TaxID=3144417 RepID=UPI003EE4B8AD